MPAEVIETIFEVIEGGASVESAAIIEFPTDVVVGETLSGTTTSVTLGNGVATEVSQLTVETVAGATETAGVGLLAIDVGVAGAAAAPILGILAGVGLYNLAPEFWTSVADKLWEAGETVGGKVRAFLNPKTKQVGLSQTTLEIFKNAFLEAGIFNQSFETVKLNPNASYIYKFNNTNFYVNVANYNTILPLFLDTRIGSYIDNGTIYTGTFTAISNEISELYQVKHKYVFNYEKPYARSQVLVIFKNAASRFQLIINNHSFTNAETEHYDCVYGDRILKKNTYGFFAYIDYSTNGTNLIDFSNTAELENAMREIYLFAKIGFPNLQPDATYPTADLTIPETYPNYKPWELPENLPVPSIYPVEIPVVKPNPSQEESQNPEPLPDNQSVADWLIDNLPQPDPVPNPPSDGGETEPPDPPDPNPEPTPGPLPIVPDMPESVNAHKMFTVYNPTDSQLNDFGGWLWTSDIIDNIVKIWAGDPIQGILSLRKVYAKPVTGSMKNIVVGYLDSGVDALEVSNQFVTIECGTVQVAEQKHNATDYPPYTSLHLYLPFIGVVELDPNEFMNGSITVTYHVDVYTGSCLAEVKATRSADMPNATILYTFTGNASQELPLSSSNFSGAISSLVSLATAGIAVASGGGLIAAGATASAIHSLTHEMIHINRSGNLSSNAGIMGSRIPYLIIGMRHGYDANAYNELYGYPANKTVYIGNCKGFTRVKAGRLRTKATEAEKKEIMQLLEKGVIL